MRAQGTGTTSRSAQAGVPGQRSTYRVLAEGQHPRHQDQLDQTFFAQWARSKRFEKQAVRFKRQKTSTSEATSSTTNSPVFTLHKVCGGQQACSLLSLHLPRSGLLYAKSFQVPMHIAAAQTRPQSSRLASLAFVLHARGCDIACSDITAPSVHSGSSFHCHTYPRGRFTKVQRHFICFSVAYVGAGSRTRGQP